MSATEEKPAWRSSGFIAGVVVGAVATLALIAISKVLMPLLLVVLVLGGIFLYLRHSDK